MNTKPGAVELYGGQVEGKGGVKRNFTTKNKSLSRFEGFFHSPDDGFSVKDIKIITR